MLHGGNVKISKSRIRQLINESIEKILNEKEGDLVQVTNRIKQSNTSGTDGSETKRSMGSRSKDLETGTRISQDNITGKLKNGVRYGVTERSITSGDGIEKHHNKTMWVGKNDNSLGITFNSKDGGKKKLGYIVNGKSANAAKFIAGIVKLKIKPKELIEVIKNAKLDLDTADIEKVQ